MDTHSHRETKTQISHFRGGRDAAVGGKVPGAHAHAAQPSVVGEARKQMMDAVSNVQTVAQVGMVKLTGGISLYLARIRQMDQGAMRKKEQARQNRPQRIERLGRE